MDFSDHRGFCHGFSVSVFFWYEFSSFIDIDLEIGYPRISIKEKKIHAERRDPSVGRETEPTSGVGDCPGGNPRARRQPTVMEAGAGCRGGADGRTRIRSHSISVRYHALGEEGWGARRRASGHGRRGGQARRRDATRDAAACRSTGGGAGEHGGARRKTIALHNHATQNQKRRPGRSARKRMKLHPP